MEKEAIKHRTIYLDHLRVLATTAVMMVHVSASNWYSTDVNGYDWKVFNLYDSIVRWGVPVFIMISGALFLNRDDITVKIIYSKYVFRMAVAYMICTPKVRHFWRCIFLWAKQEEKRNIVQNSK